MAIRAEVSKKVNTGARTNGTRTKSITSASTIKAAKTRKKTTTKAGTSKKTGTKSASAAKGKILLIVESPSKARTIGKYLGARYKVIASVGHVRDLPKSKLGIDIAHDFEPQYISIRGKGELIKELRKEASLASKVYLATDPDREGEAISWHLAFLLGIDPASPCRVEFHEITKDVVKDAVQHPRPVDLHLVDAQQARRVLDRLVGYQISPLLWRKISRGLSAGRVQSAALKIICDREREIQKFIPEEYWNIHATFQKSRTRFVARLTTKNGKKLTVQNEAENKEVLQELESGTFIVDSLTEKERKTKPYPPFTTSTLQQDAGNKLGFPSRKTMQIAQQLYEGIDIGARGRTGLITYLRTDSVRISDTAKNAAAAYIAENFGKQYVGNNFFTNKKKETQDAHEAIRPSAIDLTPESIRTHLSADQFKLYNLIWTRFMASRMTDARIKSTAANIQNGVYGFHANGSEILFDGFRRVYHPLAGTDEKALPPLAPGEELKPLKVEGEQAFTQPPARFTEASLIKELEEKNIGRPSTYAPIVSTLSGRKYVSRVKKALKPTDLGVLVDELMEEYFPEIVDADFTSQMEDRLDDIELAKFPWKKIVHDFYEPFSRSLEKADATIERVKMPERKTDQICELCGKPMVIKTGRFGDFLACSGYPACKNTKPILRSIGVKCPNCGKDIVERRSKRGKIFYGCSGYPDCKTVYWNKPIGRLCPQCGSMLTEKKTGKAKIVCSNPTCGYKE